MWCFSSHKIKTGRAKERKEDKVWKQNPSNFPTSSNSTLCQGSFFSPLKPWEHFLWKHSSIIRVQFYCVWLRGKWQFSFHGFPWLTFQLETGSWGQRRLSEAKLQVPVLMVLRSEEWYLTLDLCKQKERLQKSLWMPLPANQEVRGVTSEKRFSVYMCEMLV